MRFQPLLISLVGVACIAMPDARAVAQSEAPTYDAAVIAKIRDEGLNRSQAMATLSYLTDVIGPRLTASPSMKRANEWTRERLKGWGLQNAHLEAWGPFGRGWTLKRFSAQVVSPQDIPLIAFPKAWSPGFHGTRDVVLMDATDEAGLAKYRGKLRGAIVMTAPVTELKARFEAQGTRNSDADLEKMQNAAADAPRPRRNPGTPQASPFAAIMRLSAARATFLHDEGAALTIEPSRGGDDGTIFVQSATAVTPAGAPAGTRVNPWQLPPPAVIPQVVVSTEQYNRMVRMIQQGEHLRMDVDLAIQFTDRDKMGYNTVAEIPGMDLKDQIVMLGGHMDSWHAGTGATDNGAGVAAAMEAVRIIQTLNLHPRRTIRVALWSGEEEGLFGSRAYVAQHFGSVKATGASPYSPFGGPPPVGPLEKQAEYDRISAYFNLDNGTGKVRGIYAQNNSEVRPIFRDWLTPFHDLGATTDTISNTGSTDHVSFDAIGIPGFQFIQDPIEYGTRTHHSNQDVFDRIQADDLKQASVVMAAFVYNAAMRDQLLPRKPRP